MALLLPCTASPAALQALPTAAGRACFTRSGALLCWQAHLLLAEASTSAASLLMMAELSAISSPSSKTTGTFFMPVPFSSFLVRGFTSTFM